MILRYAICSVNVSCKGYGGNTPCPYQQHFYINDRIVTTCPYPWIYFDELTTDDIDDIKLLIDIQSKHMVQSSKDIKGSDYLEITQQRCGNIEVVRFDRIDINNFDIPTNARRNKYTELYNLIPIGDNSGFWYYRSDRITDRAYGLTTIPSGSYATITIDDPLSFSLQRVWNHICGWAKMNQIKIKPCNTVCFVKFFMRDDTESMSVYVPVNV